MEQVLDLRFEFMPKHLGTKVYAVHLDRLRALPGVRELLAGLDLQGFLQ